MREVREIVMMLGELGPPQLMAVVALAAIVVAGMAVRAMHILARERDR